MVHDLPLLCCGGLFTPLFTTVDQETLEITQLRMLNTYFYHIIVGNFRKVFIFGYFEKGLLFKNEFQDLLFFINKFP